MKFNGLKYLNSNWYDYIMIRNLYLDETKIDIKCNDKIDNITISPIFYDNIKKLSDKDKINEIIRYYLRNNKIHSLEDNAILNYYEGNFIAIEGTRNLYLQLKEDSIDNEIKKEIKEKYIKDRYEYIFNNNFKNIEICLLESETSYSTYIENEEEILSINLMNREKNLLPFEKEFFNEFIKYLFNTTNKKIDYYVKGASVHYLKNFQNLKFGEFFGFYFKSDKFLIKVNKSLFNDLYYLMIEHNNKIDNIKKLQLNFFD